MSPRALVCCPTISLTGRLPHSSFPRIRQRTDQPSPQWFGESVRSPVADLGLKRESRVLLVFLDFGSRVQPPARPERRADAGIFSESVRLRVAENAHEAKSLPIEKELTRGERNKTVYYSFDRVSSVFQVLLARVVFSDSREKFLKKFLKYDFFLDIQFLVPL
jgi:hypothetical protein